MNKTLLKMAISFGATLPLFAFAQSTTVFTLLQTIDNILSKIIPMIMVAATIVFLWGVVMYITAGGDEKKGGNAKTLITSGLLGLFFMVAIWGIVRAIVSTFSVGGTGIPAGPGATF